MQDAVSIVSHFRHCYEQRLTRGWCQQTTPIAQFIKKVNLLISIIQQFQTFKFSCCHLRERSLLSFRVTFFHLCILMKIIRMKVKRHFLSQTLLPAPVPSKMNRDESWVQPWQMVTIHQGYSFVHSVWKLHTKTRPIIKFNCLGLNTVSSLQSRNQYQNFHLLYWAFAENRNGRETEVRTKQKLIWAAWCCL